MPYKSKAQAAFMHAVHPKIAEQWDAKYGGVSKDAPKKKKAKPKKRKK